MSWSDSRGATLASNAKLLNELLAYPDTAVAHFVAQEIDRLARAADVQTRADEESGRERDECFE
jgi:hypothetical protein